MNDYVHTATVITTCAIMSLGSLSERMFRKDERLTANQNHEILGISPFPSGQTYVIVAQCGQKHHSSYSYHYSHRSRYERPLIMEPVRVYP